ncbi:MAG: cupin domain-containing protein [Anaerolineales bacterium]|nr:cupin domain-containing protein [Anaerolineales bacterium]
MKHFNFSDVKRKPIVKEQSVYELVGRAAVAKQDKFSVTRIVMQGDDTVPAHYHKKSDEVYVVLNGSAEMVVDDSKFKLKPGDIVVLELDELHCIDLADGETLEFLAISSPAFSADDHINA